MGWELTPTLYTQVHGIIVPTQAPATGCSHKPPDFRNLQPETAASLLYTGTLALGERVYSKKEQIKAIIALPP